MKWITCGCHILKNIWKKSLYTACRNVKECNRYIYTNKTLVLYIQPTPLSHPHLLQKDEITPRLTITDYRWRRDNFIQKIKESSAKFSKSVTHHLVVIPSASITYMSESIPYPFRQHSDFLYLCGFKEPGCILVFKTTLESNTTKCVLFVPKPSSVSEKWDGVKMSLNETTQFLGIDKTLYTDEFENYLEIFAKQNKSFTVWYDISNSKFHTQQTMQNFFQSYSKSMLFEIPRPIIHKCRLLKVEPEVRLMKKTCKIGAEAMKEVIRISRPSISESHLFAKWEFECRMRGADHLAFPPVIAGDARANTIHYIDNNQIINDNEMVLMDAGCEYNGYCSDLARTWPVNGKFSEPQREIYDAVLSVQLEVIELCNRTVSLDFLFKEMCNSLGQKLQDLNVISKYLNTEEVFKETYRFCPHHVSHYLGMDVHDTDAVSRGIKIQPGMVFTIEPGVYISSTDKTVPKKYRGICVRIEDDVLITDRGVEVLTSDCPKTVEGIEELFKQTSI